MRKAIFCMLVMAAGGAGACRGTPVNPKHERPAPPDRFVVTTTAGMRLDGAAARVDIRYLDAAKAPEVEVAFSASLKSGRAWVVRSAAPSDFLETLTLSAQVVNGPLERGQASVQVSLPGADASFAPSGRLQLRLQAGRMVGETSGMNDEFSARFEGPFVVTCAVPAATMAAGAPAPTSRDTRPTLVVDVTFESALCKPYAALAGWSG